MKYFYLLLFSPIIIFSQFSGIEWQLGIGDGNDTGGANSRIIFQTKDGGYIFGGISNFDGGGITGNHGNFDFVVIKLNEDRSILWSKSYGGSFYDVLESIYPTNDGGYVLAGLARSNDGDVSNHTNSDGDSGHGNGDFWIVKIDSEGQIQWEKTYGGSHEDGARDIKQTSDGGYIVTGYAWSTDGDVSGHHGSGNFDYWVIKLNTIGDLEWQKCLGGSKNDISNSIVFSNDGGYVISGGSNSNDGDVTGHHGEEYIPDFWIVKIDPTGTIIWEKSYGGSGAEDNLNAVKIQNDNNDGYIVLGNTFSNDGDVEFNHGQRDIWLLKLNNSGELDWQKTIGGTNNDKAGYAICTSDNGVLIVGSSYSDDGDMPSNNGDNDIIMTKLDSFGNIEWSENIGGGQEDDADYVSKTNDNGYIVSGSTNSHSGDVDVEYRPIWIFKIFAETMNTKEMQPIQIKLYPNPTEDFITINSNSAIEKIEIYNANGEIVYHNQINSELNSVINVNHFPSGFYLVSIQTSEGIQTRKFLRK